MTDLSMPPSGKATQASDAGEVDTTMPAEFVATLPAPLELEPLQDEHDGAFKWPTPPYASYPAPRAQHRPEPCEIEGINGKMMRGHLTLFVPEDGLAHVQVPPSKTTMALRFNQFRSLALTAPLSPARVPAGGPHGQMLEQRSRTPFKVTPVQGEPSRETNAAPEGATASSHSQTGPVSPGAVASPCTAPFMGASLGFAIGLPAGEAMGIFLALGVGMALPYLLMAWVPAIARWLPRPGAWMETFRRLMAFPMLATVAWLVWVLGQQAGIDGAGALLALLVALSMVVWAFTLHGRGRLALSIVALASLGFAAWSFGPAITRTAAAEPALAAASDRWQPWTPDRVQQLVGAGRPVFVDFTAAWCVTCQYNKKTTLANAAVLSDFDAGKFALLRADWTRRDPTITQALAGLGRNGVPVYVIYRQGRAPVVLSEVLSVDEVRSAIAQ